MFQRRAPVIGGARAPDFYKRLLCQVLHPVRVALITVENGKHPRLMPPDHFGEIIGRGAQAWLRPFVFIAHVAGRSLPESGGSRHPQIKGSHLVKRQNRVKCYREYFSSVSVSKNATSACLSAAESGTPPLGCLARFGSSVVLRFTPVA